MASEPEKIRHIRSSRRASDDLRRHEQRFRTMVEGTLDHAICLLDPGGLVATWNAAAKRVHGYRAHVILGHHYAAVFIPVDHAGAEAQHHLDLAAELGRIEEVRWLQLWQGTRLLRFMVT